MESEFESQESQTYRTVKRHADRQNTVIENCVRDEMTETTRQEF